MSIPSFRSKPCVHVYTMSSECQITEVQKYKLQKNRETDEIIIFRNTEIKMTGIQKIQIPYYKLQIEIQVTKIQK